MYTLALFCFLAPVCILCMPLCALLLGVVNTIYLYQKKGIFKCEGTINVWLLIFFRKCKVFDKRTTFCSISV